MRSGKEPNWGMSDEIIAQAILNKTDGGILFWGAVGLSGGGLLHHEHECIIYIIQANIVYMRVLK